MDLYQTIVNILLENKPLLLFLVIAIGYYIGRIKVGGFSFGVAAVLFVGLAFGAMHPDMALPDIIYVMGLVLFVYTIGLRSGPAFFASFKKSGIRDNAMIVCVLLLSAALTGLLGNLFQVKNTVTAGLFCGALTNTPALASVLEVLKQTPGGASAALLAEPVVGYSLAYPIGVIGVLLLFQFGMSFWKIDMQKEQKRTGQITGMGAGELHHSNVLVTANSLAGKTWAEIIEAAGVAEVVASRRLPYGTTEIEVPSDNTVIQSGDILTLVGPSEEANKLIKILGQPTEKDLTLDRRNVGMRRIFVSNKRIVGKSIRELDLYEKYHAVITRLRRGDVDLPISDDMRLEAGDRVRVIAPKEKIKEIGKYLGDSFQRISEVDYISISIGIVLGLLLGMVPIPFPGGSVFKLGFAAGPLLVALYLGRLGRTGKIVWVMSLNANLTLRQLGAVFFLAGIGLKAGYSFYETFQTAGFRMILLGAIITILTAGIGLVIGRVFFKIPYNLLMGMISAMHTQPACLAFANEKDETGAANIGYATVFPTAMVVKIILAQVLLGFM